MGPSGDDGESFDGSPVQPSRKFIRWRTRAKRLHFGPLPLNQATPMRFRGARKRHSEPFGVPRQQSRQSAIAVLGPQLAVDTPAITGRQRVRVL